MGFEFKLTQEQPQGKPKIAVFHLTGWLDALSEGRLVEAVQMATAGGAEYVLLDLRDLDTVTSAGIRAMQKSYEILTPKDEAYKIARLKLCNAPAQIYKVLGITGILANVPMYESMEDAILSFGK